MKNFDTLGEDSYRGYVKRNPQGIRRCLLSWIISVLFLTGAVIFFYATEPITVNFIDVGQGDACFIQGGKDGDILIDGGDQGSGNIIKNYLISNGIYSLDGVFISHFHADHMLGIMELMDMGYPIKCFYVSDMETGVELEKEFYEEISKRSIPVNKVKTGDKLQLGCMKYEILWPGGKGNEYDLNNGSMVLRVDYGENSFLMAGDIEKSTEKEIVDEYKEKLDVDVIKVSHHGSNTSSTDEFLDATTPQYAVFPVGYGNRYSNPSKKVVDRVEDVTEGIWRTDMNGTVSFTIDEEKIKNVRYTDKF